MKKLEEYTAKDIQEMDYNQLIGLVRETNRVPGGLNSIIKISQCSFLNSQSRILEIGTSTGITAIEMAKLIGCKINAIDINQASINEAKKRAKNEGVESLINFEIQDATMTTFQDDYFDMVFCGNVTSLISNRNKALIEYIRVLKKGGLVAAIPMYYIKPPSSELLSRVSNAIKVKIVDWDKAFWINFFSQDTLSLIWHENYKFNYIDDGTVKNFCTDILNRDHLTSLSQDAFKALTLKYRECMMLFRDNLSHMGYTLMLLRKENSIIEPELFTSSIITN